MKGKYKFVRFKSLIDGEESKKWWLVATTLRDLNDHAEKFFIPAMQEGFNIAAKDAVDAIFKFGEVSLMHHPTNDVARAIETISGINYERSPMAFFNTANEMLKTTLKGRGKKIESGKTIYLEDGVREFGFSPIHYEIIEEYYSDELVYPDFLIPTLDDVKYIQWTGGYHWYAKVNREDVVDELGNQKWNTKKEAEEAAKWYITKYY